MQVDTAGRRTGKASWASAPAEREVADRRRWHLSATRVPAVGTAANRVPSERTSAALPPPAAVAANTWPPTASAAAAAAEADDGKSVMQEPGRR